MSTFVVPASDIDAAGLSLDAVLPVRWLESSLQVEGLHAPEEGHVTVRLSRSGRSSIVVRGHATAKVTLPCARCLDPATFEVDGELALLLAQRSPQKGPPGAKAAPSKPGSRGAPRPRPSEARGKSGHVEEYEFTDEEAQEDEYDGETVVLDPFIREAILLELPTFPLCSDSCPGITATVPQPAFTAPHPFEALRFFGREGEAEEPAAPKNGKARPAKMSLSHRALPKKAPKKAAKAAAKKTGKKKPAGA